MAKGLLVFNQDAADMNRVNLMHLSIMDDEKNKFEEVLDLALTYIWTTMHNATVRVTLHHFN